MKNELKNLSKIFIKFYGISLRLNSLLEREIKDGLNKINELIQKETNKKHRNRHKHNVCKVKRGRNGSK